MKPGRRMIFLIFVSLFIGLYLAWLVLVPGETWERFWVGNLAMIFSGLAASWLALRARRSSADPRLKAAWAWLTAGVMLWTSGDLLRMAMQARYPERYLEFGLTDLVYLIGSAALLTGLLLYPRGAVQRSGRLRLLIDTTITTAAALTMVWLLVLQPVAAAGLNGQGDAAAIFYPSADLILLLLLLVLFLVSEAGSLPAPLGWLSIGLGIYLFSDLAYAYLILDRAYLTGSLVNFGWLMGDCFLILAAWIQIQPAKPSIPSKFTLKITQRLQSLLPLGATLVLGLYTLFEWQLQGNLQTLGLWVTVVLALGFIARQSILAGEIEFQQYAGLVNSIAEPTFICTKQGQLGLTNPALLQITGYTHPEELLGLPLQQLVRPSNRVAEILSASLGGGWSGEVSLLRRDGSWSPVFLSLRLLSSGRGDGLALAGTAHNLTEIKRQQSALQQAYEKLASTHMQLELLNSQLEQRVDEKTASLTEAYGQLERQNLALQNLDRLKSDFVSLVSHELRAPLTNINGGIELVLSRSSKMPVKARGTLTLVQAEIMRLTRFIETILDLSALDAGRMPLYPAPVVLRAIVDGLKRQMLHLPGAERVSWNIPARLPELLADEQALFSILFHLVDNALKYAPTGRIDVTAGVDPGGAWISVEDEGDGIPEKDIPLLFSRFFRSRSSDAQVVYGHGLGLYIVHRLVDAMDGKIEISNRPEKGACFTCRLPIATNQQAGDEFENEQQNPVGG